MSEGVASIVSLATRKVLRCNKELLEHITVMSAEGANCKLMKRQQQLDSLTLRFGDGEAQRAQEVPPTQCDGEVLPLTG
ncbi:hypothetical protein HPB47_020424 [Ixodes persulcatus]|uniref:Uncharacterized protein n=1 Tax=Ixodes persulcatus TaxID=34615 RepID=A0AC60QJ06_IXOPE|nr:hypothetical protein HPB47_020424 [Ixodes persulcatus]